jgi:hypothetical protein
MAEAVFIAPRSGGSKVEAGATSRRFVGGAMRKLVWMASFLATLTAAWTAWACPRCAVGITARQQVWDDGFATNLVVALVPFVLVAMVSVWAERIGRAR